MRLVPVTKLKLDTKIALDIRDEHANLLITKENIITPHNLKRLRNSNVKAVYIKDKYCFDYAPDTSDPSKMFEQVVALKKAIENAMTNKSTSESITDALKAIRVIVNELDKQKYCSKISYEPQKLDIADEFGEKTVYVAIMSSLFALKLGFSKQETYLICLGALLKDVALIVPELKKTVGAASKIHPTTGYEYLIKNFNFPQEVLDIVQQHHELYNGKGYPNCLKGDRIYAGARIIAIIDMFYKVSNNYYEQGSKTLEEGFLKFSGYLDPYFLQKFWGYSHIFSPDMLVKLTNSDVAVVMSARSFNPFQPQVRILKSNTYQSGTLLNLFEIPHLNISRVIHYVE
ncbi:MAG: hypothetical protein BEN18_08265 [Epulopiscium sp. Nuni2H_MBin001]|nr:MAG: hypothetical protein BEN18_08265 [Epulopiscium sp. Nuni2H_MBin001]